MFKRLFDIVCSLVGLAVTAALFPFVALAIVIGDGLPVLVSLERVSSGRVIRVHKFRSMVRGAHLLKVDLSDRNERQDGPLFKMKNDPRVTVVGRVIRRFKVDEFPQFWDVLLSNLSIVGPRPHEPGEVSAYPDGFRFITESKAGITGLSQVSGASSLSFHRELELDRSYLEHRSVWVDLKIIIRTLWLLVTDPRGV